MLQPAHIDGSSLIVLRQHIGKFRAPYEIIETGLLSFDGEELMFETQAGTRPFTLEEQAKLLVVSDSNPIAECQGYRLFMLDVVE